MLKGINMDQGGSSGGTPGLRSAHKGFTQTGLYLSHLSSFNSSLVPEQESQLVDESHFNQLDLVHKTSQLFRREELL